MHFRGLAQAYRQGTPVPESASPSKGNIFQGESNMQTPTNDRFERTDDAKVEQVFDDICGLTMAQLRALSALLCSRLSLRVIGSFATTLNAATAEEPQARAEALSLTVKSIGSLGKVDAIRAARAIMGLGLKESRDFVDALPHAFEPAESGADAEASARRWTEAGFEIDLR
jgi:large subunit ribosomal protein L7/L12